MLTISDTESGSASHNTKVFVLLLVTCFLRFDQIPRYMKENDDLERKSIKFN